MGKTAVANEPVKIFNRGIAACRYEVKNHDYE
jgi:hypothetical protein